MEGAAVPGCIEVAAVTTDRPRLAPAPRVRWPDRMAARRSAVVETMWHFSQSRCERLIDRPQAASATRSRHTVHTYDGPRVLLFRFASGSLARLPSQRPGGVVPGRGVSSLTAERCGSDTPAGFRTWPRSPTSVTRTHRSRSSCRPHAASRVRRPRTTGNRTRRRPIAAMPGSPRTPGEPRRDVHQVARERQRGSSRSRV